MSGYRLTVLQSKIYGKFKFGSLSKLLRIHTGIYWKNCSGGFLQGQGYSKAVEEYDLPSFYTVQMWIRQFQKQLKSGMIVLPTMIEQHKANLKAAEHRIKELEKALEYANEVIFSLNHLIDFSEKEFSIPIRKKAGTKQ